MYTCLLPKDAQHSLGKVHKLTEPAKKLLEQEGFKFKGYIDLFDAGPALHANLNKIKSIKNSAIYTAIKNQQSNHNNFNHKLCLISNTKLNKWRVIYSNLGPCTVA